MIPGTPRRSAMLISASLLAALAGNALAAGDPAPTDQRADQPPAATTATAAAAATAALDLQPGDERIINAAIGQPLEFVSIAGEREFTGELIVHAKSGKADRANRRVGPLTLHSSAFVDEHVVRVPAGTTEGQMAAALMATGDYEFVEPNWRLFPAATPNDPQFGSSWQHTRLQSTAAWDLHTGGSDVIVAVCDSGVDTDHPDLAASLVPGFNAASRRPQATGGEIEDINGHGTFVAGCAAARGNNNTGVVGVGWDFSIMPIRVTNNTNGFANGFDILEGARWAAENGAQIINASFSGGTSSANQTAGRYIKEQGGLLFWAAGNDGAYISPNRPDYVIVGSTTSSDNRSGFSNYGPAVDVTAPGSGVRSTRRFGLYGNSSGTSYASPIAAGVGAMIFSVNSQFNPHDVQDILYNSVDDLGAPGRDDHFGRGRVNTRKAIELAMIYERPLLAPINESFEDSAWQDLLTTTEGTVETSTPAQAPDGQSVLVLNENDRVETVRLAGRTIDDPTLGFWLRASSIEAGESLTVEYLQDPEIAPDTWITLGTINGQGRTGDEFVRYDYQLPFDFAWHGVKIRFAADGSDSGDMWMIDGLSIDTLGDSIAPLAEDFEANQIPATRWEEIENTLVAFDDNNFYAAMGDGGELESRDIPLFQFGFVPSFIRFDAWTDTQAMAGDTLAVEFFNIGGLWEVLEVIDAADLDTDPQQIALDIPFNGWALDDMKIRLTSTTAGAFHIDNIYVGPEAPGGPCNQADLAEPFGELNFFDLSAFLSAFNAQEPAADINDDGVYNFFDVSSFLSTFTNGCP
ncbi:MAG: S8 family serine peptidase [Phycisphaerales bacterium]